jgi:quercetin dioxygenase-like cupin family protein
MALPHARPLDIIDLDPLPPGPAATVTTSLLKARGLQLMRLVLDAGRTIPEHRVQGPITLQCLQGEAEITTSSRTCRLHAGQLVMLPGGEPHGVHAITDASVLVTIVLPAAHRPEHAP